MLRRFTSIGFACGLAACAGVAGVACSTSSSGPTGQAGGAVSGPDDTHCAGKKRQTNDSACHPSLDAGTDGSDDASSTDDADAGSEYGATLFNQSGFDDDCKYQVSWTSDPIVRGANVTFHLSAMKTFDGVWACGANPYVEAFLDETHPAPNTDPHTSEVGTGKYDIGPIKFDKAGRWTVRFHLYADCSDLTADSPHGHAAFFIDVP